MNRLGSGVYGLLGFQSFSMGNIRGTISPGGYTVEPQDSAAGYTTYHIVSSVVMTTSANNVNTSRCCKVRARATFHVSGRMCQHLPSNATILN